jgi:hypothetical protein
MQVVPDCKNSQRTLPPLILTADYTDYTGFSLCFHPRHPRNPWLKFVVRMLPALILTADCTDYTDFFSVCIRAIRG